MFFYCILCLCIVTVVLLLYLAMWAIIPLNTLHFQTLHLWNTRKTRICIIIIIIIFISGYQKGHKSPLNWPPLETVNGNSAENNESETPKTFSIGLWVLVKCDIAKTEKCYTGRITDKVQDLEDRCEVHFLKRSNRCSSTFTDALTGDQASDESMTVISLCACLIQKSVEDFTVSTTILIAMRCCKRWPKTWPVSYKL